MDSFVFHDLIKRPEGDGSALFHFRQFKCFPSFVYDEDGDAPSLCTCYPFLIFAWDIGADMNSLGRYEFALAVKSKETETLWLNKLHPGGAFNYYDASQEEEKICNSFLDNYCGTLPQLATTCPNEGRDWRATIQNAASKLYASRQPIALYGDQKPSNFGIFAWRQPRIITNRECIYSILEKRLNPKKITTPLTKRKVSSRLRRFVLERDGCKCVDCGRSPANDESCILHVDHRQPLAKGGTNDAANLQTLCDWCNLGKGVSLDWKL